MNEQQAEALLNEIRTLRREVRGVRLWSRLIAVLLLVTGIAVAVQYGWFFMNVFYTIIIGAAGCLLLWVLRCVFLDFISAGDKPREPNSAPAEQAP